MEKYRKKPIIVEAVQITKEWFSQNHPNPLHMKGILIDPVQKNIMLAVDENTADIFAVPTMEGVVDDWIIIYPPGKRHLCKPQVFEAHYEKVNK